MMPSFDPIQAPAKPSAPPAATQGTAQPAMPSGEKPSFAFALDAAGGNAARIAESPRAGTADETAGEHSRAAGQETVTSWKEAAAGGRQSLDPEQGAGASGEPSLPVTETMAVVSGPGALAVPPDAAAAGVSAGVFPGCAILPEGREGDRPAVITEANPVPKSETLAFAPACFGTDGAGPAIGSATGQTTAAAPVPPGAAGAGPAIGSATGQATAAAPVPPGAAGTSPAIGSTTGQAMAAAPVPPGSDGDKRPIDQPHGAPEGHSQTRTASVRTAQPSTAGDQGQRPHVPVPPPADMGQTHPTAAEQPEPVVQSRIPEEKAPQAEMSKPEAPKPAVIHHQGTGNALTAPIAPADPTLPGGKAPAQALWPGTPAVAAESMPASPAKPEIVAPDTLPAGPPSISGGVTEKGAAPMLKAASSPSFPAQPVTAQIVERASLHVGGGEMRIELKPEFLGSLKIRVATENHLVTLKIVTESPMVKEMIESQMHLLKNDLGLHGLRIDKVEVTVARDFNAYDETRREAAFQSARDNRDTGDRPAAQGRRQGSGGRAPFYRSPRPAGIDYFA